ncbi:hypothetical protein CLUG_05160 [Clavispora lusitaniae ATCC 42720]|uniref:Uncharacterized protein n=1 Tax=Clavispora lusitaniae (strain ATCC 42720) TaxID=306902 RepID=C4Y9T9_CLAL4|nr:uncharacterized protein CLUG_05160 [Clavispora lusitaniae ATCC 42720]EEQ41032.1 hypothetical protein CLUG_05160 [Clavispora lusitaniae ATCC 42720]
MVYFGSASFESCGSAIRVTRFGHRCTLISHNGGTLDFCNFTHNHSTYIQSHDHSTYIQFTIIYFHSHLHFQSHDHHTILQSLYIYFDRLNFMTREATVVYQCINYLQTNKYPSETTQATIRECLGESAQSCHPPHIEKFCPAEHRPQKQVENRGFPPPQEAWPLCHGGPLSSWMQKVNFQQWQVVPFPTRFRMQC